MDFVAAIPQFHSVGTGVSTGYRPIAVHSGQFRSRFLAEALEIESQYSNKCITSFGSRQESQPAFLVSLKRYPWHSPGRFAKNAIFQQKDNLLHVSGYFHMIHAGLFVVGTDTGVGKTTVAVAVIGQLVGQGVRVGVYKPVSTGSADGSSDSQRLWDAAGRPLSLEKVCPQVFSLAIAPPHSARAEGTTVNQRLLFDGIVPWRQASHCVVVEGAGGLFSPLGDTLLNVDLARDFGLPVVIVDSAKLGAIGRSLANVRAAQASGLRVAAVVLSHIHPVDVSRANDPASDAGIARASAIDLAARLAPIPVVGLAYNSQQFSQEIDWLALASCER